MPVENNIRSNFTQKNNWPFGSIRSENWLIQPIVWCILPIFWVFDEIFSWLDPDYNLTFGLKSQFLFLV
jgi:hypothetical protein